MESKELTRPLSLGWVSYANFFPVAFFLVPWLKSRGSSLYEYLEGPPSLINKKISQGHLQVALSSSVNLVSTPGCLPLVPVGICSRQRVSSAYLEMDPPDYPLLAYIQDANKKLSQSFNHGPHHNPVHLDSWQKAAATQTSLDPKIIPALDLGKESQSSAALALIFYKLWFGSEVAEKWDLKERHITPSSSSSTTTLRLHLGDSALKRRKVAAIKLDLAQIWHQLTAHPFVFATWMQTSSCDSSQLAELKEGILQATEKASEKIISDPYGFFSPVDHHFNQRLLKKEQMVDYWSRLIYYEMKDKEQDALQLFLHLASQVLRLPS